ncbi:MAG: hypothetical protein BGO78_04385 [Chloroflexi bacterium 44-23]|nr:MAG: hypothetical protein BGO78_04385 [Chloroflexi bacterium 44-23]
MYLTHLSLTNFRAFTRLDMDVPGRILLLQGNNAQGKTSLLEAIYLFSTFTSIQAATDRQLINFSVLDQNPAVARLVADYSRGDQNHNLEVRLILEKNGENSGARFRKEILVDGVKRNAQQAVTLFNAVIFLPQMTRIIEGGPEERRRYLNLALAQIVPGYAQALSEYSQILSQRNALLKQLAEGNSDLTLLDYWDSLLAERAVLIMQARLNAIHEIELIAAEFHRKLANDQEILTFSYLPAFFEGAFSSIDITRSLDIISREDAITVFLKNLASRRRDEITRGVTTLGPHRDELRLKANSIDLGDYGSRGQVRTALLSLKLAEVGWMKQQTGHHPLLLLDETLAELDQNRRDQLLSSIEEGQQAILTTTDLKLFAQKFVKRATIWHIRQGIVNQNNLS